jgi:hypothetical protein
VSRQKEKCRLAAERVLDKTQRPILELFSRILRGTTGTRVDWSDRECMYAALKWQSATIFGA